MDFSSKQALGVVVVLALAAIVVFTGIQIANNNSSSAQKSTNSMWDKVNTTITTNGWEQGGEMTGGN